MEISRFDRSFCWKTTRRGVADGLRSLGSPVDRKRVPVAAGVAAQENEIDFVHVKEADYDARFLRCVELVKR